MDCPLTIHTTTTSTTNNFIISFFFDASIQLNKNPKFVLKKKTSIGFCSCRYFIFRKLHAGQFIGLVWTFYLFICFLFKAVNEKRTPIKLSLINLCHCTFSLWNRQLMCWNEITTTTTRTKKINLICSGNATKNSNSMNVCSWSIDH